jgi:hypothetical protein
VTVLLDWLRAAPWDGKPHSAPPYGRRAEFGAQPGGWGVTLTNERGHMFDAVDRTLEEACVAAVARAKRWPSGDPERLGR